MGKVQQAAGGGLAPAEMEKLVPGNIVAGTSIKSGGQTIQGEYPFAGCFQKDAKGGYSQQIIANFSHNGKIDSPVTKTFLCCPGKNI